MRFVKKPIIVEAVQVPEMVLSNREDVEMTIDWLHKNAELPINVGIAEKGLWINSVMGTSFHRQGVWFIKELENDIYTLDDDQFRARFEKGCDYSMWVHDEHRRLS